MIEIELDLSEIMDYFEDISERMKHADVLLEKETKRQSAKFLRKVKLKTPVDTGVLRRRWIEDNVSKSNNTYSSEITNNVEYVGYVNDGHRTRGGKSFVPGVHMVEKAGAELEQELEADIDKLMKKLFE